MIGNKYKYALIDMSYVLSRNIYGVSVSRGPKNYTEGDVIKLTIQTLSKITKDYDISADKFIFIYDKWDKNLGGYYRSSLIKELGGDYKGSRVFINDQYVVDLKNKYTEEFRNRTDVTNEEIEAAKKEIESAENKAYENKIKTNSKYIMINELGNFGVPCLGLDGWEYDDLAWLSACLLFSDSDPKPSVIITKDSDLTYSLTPKMDYFKIPTGGSTPKIITYNEMYSQIPQDLIEKGMTLYNYKSYLDSLGTGHNDMSKTMKPRKNVDQVILNILNGNYDDLTDKDMFLKQMSTFDLRKFPRLDEAKNMIWHQFNSVGKLGSIQDFKNLCNKYKIEGISDTYYNNFITRFDQTLYKG